MKKLHTQKAIRGILTTILLLLSTMIWAAPPVFIDPIPEDITISCINDFPDPINLDAMDDMNNVFSVPSIDNPIPESIDPCIGGIITRTWTATDGNGMTTVATQEIMVLADSEPPLITLTPPNDTVSCEVSGLDAPLGPYRYDTWINSLRLAISTHIDDCSGVMSITDNAPASFESPCNSLNVTFVVTDNCGRATPWVATYTVIDTIPPVLLGIESDTIIGCDAAIPPPADVTAVDNCSGIEIFTYNSFSTQSDDQSCTHYEYNISRTWLARDSCGNSVQYSQLITVRDQESPDFSAPDNLAIPCDMDPSDINITGNISGLSDNCTPIEDIIVSFTNDTIPGACPNNYLISRTWRAQDACGNIRSKIQSISVYDIEAPTYIAPEDITVDCSSATDISTTGAPMNLADNCSDSITVQSFDVVIEGDCLYNYEIRRTWNVADLCGNSDNIVQIITVKDSIAPAFQAPPQDLTIYCGSGVDINQAFSDWITNKAGAQALDNCSPTGQLTWEVYNEGTTDIPSLPPALCPSLDSVIIGQTVSFIVTDECGNVAINNATFRYIDDEAPILSNCPADTALVNAPGDCFATYNLPLPTITENCISSSFSLSLNGNAPVTSNALPGEESTTPVSEAVINMNIGQPLPLNAITNGTLTVHLTSVNAREDSEYFTILGEQGEIIGITGHSPTICGDADTTFNIPVAWINTWAVDGIISLSFVPNIPSDPRFAINPICNPGGSIDISLDFNAGGFDALVFEYKIDEGIRTVGDFSGINTETFGFGTHLVTYYGTDCAQNIDSCSFTITVEDHDPPSLSCLPDTLLYLTADTCLISYELPLPESIQDNCNLEGAYFQQQPLISPQALLTFDLDPNLGDYLANAKTFLFTGVAANSIQDVTLSVELRGDFDATSGYMEFYGEENTLLGNTMSSTADCNTTDQLTFTIPFEIFNQWASDGVLEINAIPHAIAVPPGLPGDGINPCNPGAVSMNGDTDGSSYMYISLSYQKVLLDYYTTGALNTSTTTMVEPQVKTTLDFPVGETQVYYIISDESGNLDSCSYTVTVLDTIAPIALCVDAATLFIEPSGLDEEVIDASSLDLGSHDNCGITSLSLFPNTFTCDDFGVLRNATLTVEDASGNQATCATIITTSPVLPMPTANSGLCGGDTLYLEANPPAGNSGNIYTFQWTDPTGAQFSTIEDPIIPTIDANNEGAYSVRIQGLTEECHATGSVFVSIQDLPFTPSLTGKATVCHNEDFRLTSDNFPTGTNVVFYWYSGVPPMGLFIDSTSVPFIDIPAPHTVGSNDFYLTVKATGCTSAPSTVFSVNVVQQPIALVNYKDTIVCEGEVINLGTDVNQAGITYSWQGPNTFVSTEQYPEIGPLQDIIDEGYYFLILTKDGGCVSEPDSTLVSIKPKPQTPTISNNSPICEGEQLIIVTSATNASAYHWHNMSGQISTTITPSFTLDNANESDAGNWQLQITQNGCNSDISLPTTVVINNRPQAEAYATPPRVCVGNDFQLQALPDGQNYEWTGPGITTQNTQNPIISDASPLNSGSYRLLVTSNEGCFDTSYVSIEVIDRISILGVSSNAPACLDGTTDVTLAASVFPPDDGSYSYEWSGPSSFSSNSNPAIIPTATASAHRGDYYLTVTSADNCETILSDPYFLDVRDIPEIPMAPSVTNGVDTHCEGDSLVLTTTNYSGGNVTYYWQIPGGGTMSTPTNKLVLSDISALMQTGDYTVYVIVDGCLSATSNPSFITVYQAPVLEAFSNTPVCDGNLIEFSTTFYENASYVWGGPDNFNAGIQSPTFLSSNQTDSIGLYFVTATQNGCVSDTAYVEVAVKPIPERPMIQGVMTDSICASDEGVMLTLNIDENTINHEANYNWYNDINGTAINEEPLMNGTITLEDFSAYANDGLYTFYAQADLNGCLSDFSPPHEVLIDRIPAITAFAGIDSVICDNQVVMLNGAAPSIGTGLWSYEGTAAGISIANPTMPQTPVNGLTVMNSPHTFRWTLSNGACQDYTFDDVVITIGEGEEPIPGDNIAACRNELINLGATPVSGANSTGVWSQLIGQTIAGVEIVDPLNPTTEVTGLLPNNIYTFTWTVTNECGERSAEIVAYVSDPFPFAGEDMIFCNEDATGVLQAQEPTLGSAGIWRALNPAVQIMDELSDTTIVSNLQEGENVFVWTIDEGICGEASSDTVVITYKLPPIAIDDVISVAFDTPTSFDVLINDEVSGAAVAEIFSDPMKGGAETKDGQIIYTPPPNFVGQDQFTYQINSEGCPFVTGEVDLIIGEGVGCDIPSIFTPNGDGVNDNFVIPCLLDGGKFPTSSVIVFNKWGDEVYRSTSPYKNNWKGTYNGADLPPDTYFYIIDLGDGSDPYSGFIVIQK